MIKSKLEWLSEQKQVILWVLPGILFVWYVSWLPQPSLKGILPMPVWLADFTDRYGNLRTAIPFIAVGFICGVRLVFLKYDQKRWWQSWLLLLLAATIAELGQLLLPNRYPDWMDIFYGGLGAGLGLLLIFWASKLLAPFTPKK